jgi:hypothetical protein
MVKAEREREKKMRYKGKSIKKTAEFSAEFLKTRRAWSELFQAMKENNFSPRILYTAKLLSKIYGGINVFYDKQKLTQYMITKIPLQNILKGILHTKDENKFNHERIESIKPQKNKRQVIREYH